LHNTSWASENSHKLVPLLVGRGGDVNAQDNQGKTALLFAAFRCYTDTVELLPDLGAHINVADIHSETPLHYASCSLKDNGKLVKFLLDRGADIGVRNKDGETAVQVATKNGHTNSVKLVDRCAD
jgi:ankyrin repeat protein